MFVKGFNMTVIEAQMSMAQSVLKPWHGLGIELAGGTIEERLKQAGLDWTVERRQLTFEIKGPGLIGQAHVDSHFALVRTDTNQLLSVVTNDWQPVQNTDAFGYFDRIIEAGGMRMTHAGVLDESRLVWALAKLDRHHVVIDGDVIEFYLLFTNPHMYGRSLELRLMPMRSVNQTTISIALKGEALRIKLDSLDEKAVFEMLHQVNNHIAFYSAAATKLAETPIENEQVNKYLSKLFPNESIKNKAELSRPAKDMKALITTQPGAEFAPGSWWQVYNAVAFSIDHILGHTQESRLKSSWYGFNRDRKVKALDNALAFASI